MPSTAVPGPDVSAAAPAAAPPYLRWLLLVLLGITALRLAVLAASGLGLYGDEAQYWSWSRDLAWGYYTKPPLIAFVIRASTAVCGEGEACVRAASPLFHAATALVLFHLGRALYGARVGFWAGLIFATLPAVSLSSAVISTDTPLLLAFAAGLLAYVKVLQTRSLGWAAAMGAALGLGMLAKYAMAYLLLSAVLHAALTRDARWWLTSRHLPLTVGLGVALLAPNLAWNLAEGWVTFGHVGQNANIGGSLFHPRKGLEFIAGQLGVFGPIPFVVLAWRAWLWTRRPPGEAERLLLCFALPILAIVTVGAFLSRANANWAASAYVAATVLVGAALAGGRLLRWAHAAVALHAVVLVAVSLFFLDLPGVQPPLRSDPLRKLRAWPETVRQVDDAVGRAVATVLLTEERMVMAQLLYYLPPAAPRPVIWDWNGRPDNQYELVSRYQPRAGDHVLFVTGRADPHDVLAQFARAEPAGRIAVPVGGGRERLLWLFRLEGFRGPA